MIIPLRDIGAHTHTETDSRERETDKNITVLESEKTMVMFWNGLLEMK